MDWLEIVWLFQSPPLLHCDSSQTVSAAPPLCSVRSPSVVDVCHQRRHMAATRCLSNLLTVSRSPIPNYFAQLFDRNAHKRCFLVFSIHSQMAWMVRGPTKGAPPCRFVTSCCPRYGCAVLLGLHAQSRDARGLSVGVHVEVIRIDGCRHAGPSEQTAHVSLSHVASRTGHAQKIRHSAGRVGVRCHAGSHSVAGHDAARHRRRCAAASDPGRVLNLEHFHRTAVGLLVTSWTVIWTFLPTLATQFLSGRGPSLLLSTY